MMFANLTNTFTSENSTENKLFQHSLLTDSQTIRICFHPDHIPKAPVIKRKLLQKVAGVKAEAIYTIPGHVIVKLDSGESAKKAISELNGKILFGHKFSVMYNHEAIISEATKLRKREQIFVKNGEGSNSSGNVLNDKTGNETKNNDKLESGLSAEEKMNTNIEIRQLLHKLHIEISRRRMYEDWLEKIEERDKLIMAKLKCLKEEFANRNIDIDKDKDIQLLLIAQNHKSLNFSTI